MSYTNKNIIKILFTILFIILLSLPRFISLAFSNEIRDLIAIIVGALVLILMIYEIHVDIKRKQFTTNIYLALIDIIQVVAFAVLGYLSFKRYDKGNIEAVLKRNEFSILFVLLFVGTSFLKDFFKSEAFKKK